MNKRVYIKYWNNETGLGEFDIKVEEVVNEDRIALDVAMKLFDYNLASITDLEFTACCGCDPISGTLELHEGKYTWQEEIDEFGYINDGYIIIEGR